MSTSCHFLIRQSILILRFYLSSHYVIRRYSHSFIRTAEPDLPCGPRVLTHISSVGRRSQKVSGDRLRFASDNFLKKRIIEYSPNKYFPFSLSPKFKPIMSSIPLNASMPSGAGPGGRGRAGPPQQQQMAQQQYQQMQQQQQLRQMQSTKHIRLNAEGRIELHCPKEAVVEHHRTHVLLNKGRSFEIPSEEVCKTGY
jgi:hypothetical protein